MTTGELIRETRKKKGLTQRELGELLGMSDVGVAQWEKGLRNPRLETRQRIAKALDIDITALMSDSEREDYFDLFGTEQERIQLALGEIKRGILSKTEEAQEYGGIVTQQKRRQWSLKLAREAADKYYVSEEAFLKEIALDDCHRGSTYNDVSDNDSRADTRRDAKYGDEMQELGTSVAPNIMREVKYLLAQMNPEGQAAVLRHVEELAKIPDYKKV